jgi:hypothetical protein
MLFNKQNHGDKITKVGMSGICRMLEVDIFVKPMHREIILEQMLYKWCL